MNQKAMTDSAGVPEPMPTTQADPSVISLRNVRKEFETPTGKGALVALGDVSFDVHEGEFVAVVGPSGCGKTTLLRLIADLIPITSGKISVTDTSAHVPRIGFVFQHANLYPWRRVVDNVAFGRELRRWNGAFTLPWRRRKVREAALPLLQLVGLQDFGRYFPHQISGGMQQRANLARALAIDPTVLLMDEPFGALDAQTREGLQDELQRIALESRATVLFITHDIREAVYLADRVVVLSPRPSGVLADHRVPTPRPRGPEYQLGDEYTDLVRQIWRDVHQAQA